MRGSNRDERVFVTFRNQDARRHGNSVQCQRAKVETQNERTENVPSQREAIIAWVTRLHYYYRRIKVVLYTNTRP